jgi:hypothetical protein
MVLPFSVLLFSVLLFAVLLILLVQLFSVLLSNPAAVGPVVRTGGTVPLRGSDDAL